MKRPAHRRLTPLLACVIVAGFTSLAEGHPFPIRSAPRVGRKVLVSPPKVTIWFNEELEPASSTMAVYDSAKQEVDKGKGSVSGADATALEVDLPPLAPGIYRVYWRVKGKDTHVTEGDFTFTIAGKNP